MAEDQIRELGRRWAEAEGRGAAGTGGAGFARLMPFQLLHRADLAPSGRRSKQLEGGPYRAGVAATLGVLALLWEPATSLMSGTST